MVGEGASAAGCASGGVVLARFAGRAGAWLGLRAACGTWEGAAAGGMLGGAAAAAAGPLCCSEECCSTCACTLADALPAVGRAHGPCAHASGRMSSAGTEGAAEPRACAGALAGCVCCGSAAPLLLLLGGKLLTGAAPAASWGAQVAAVRAVTAAAELGDGLASAEAVGLGRAAGCCAAGCQGLSGLAVEPPSGAARCSSLGEQDGLTPGWGPAGCSSRVLSWAGAEQKLS